jgi:hypothetical protein
MFGYKSVVAVAAVATMIGSSAFAANVSLAPGQPAGVHKAQNISNGTLILGLGAAAVITAVAIVVSQDNNNNGGAASTFPVNTTGPATAG